MYLHLVSAVSNVIELVVVFADKVKVHLRACTFTKKENVVMYNWIILVLSRYKHAWTIIILILDLSASQ